MKATRRPDASMSPAASPSAAPVIEPNAVYMLDVLQATLRLRRSTVRREWKAGRLRVAKSAGRYYVLGEWVLEWLRGGERQPA